VLNDPVNAFDLEGRFLTPLEWGFTIARYALTIILGLKYLLPALQENYETACYKLLARHNSPKLNATNETIDVPFPLVGGMVMRVYLLPVENPMSLSDCTWSFAVSRLPGPTT